MATTAPTSPEQLQLLLNGPSLKPPPGIVPNFIDPRNHMISGKIDMMTCLVLATIAVLIRMYTKIRLMRQFQVADGCIIIGWGLFLGCLLAGWLILPIAPGVHQWDVQLKDLGHYLYYIHIGAIIYGVSIFFIKLSILLQYMQIFVPLGCRTPVFWTTHALIWLNLLFYLIMTFTTIFACSPRAKAWDPLITAGRCVNIPANYVAASAINCLSDLVILILPQISIWRLQMPLKKKLQVQMVFLIGALAFVSSVIRMVNSIHLFQSTDLTYWTWMQGIWIYPEMLCAIVVACVPPFPKFFRTLKEKSLSTKLGSSLTAFFRSKMSTIRRSTRDLSRENSNGNAAPHLLVQNASSKTPQCTEKHLTGKESLSTEESDDKQYPQVYIRQIVDIEACYAPENESQETNHKEETGAI